MTRCTAIRMHGGNSHSNATVPGGACNSANREWEPIRRYVLQMVQRVLRDEAEALRLTFGEERHSIAERLMADAVGALAGRTGGAGKGTAAGAGAGPPGRRAVAPRPARPVVMSTRDE